MSAPEKETRRNAAACFKNRNKAQEWESDFTGIMVVEGLASGDKCWVNIHKRLARKGDEYFTVTINPYDRS
jgi:hypothetical protein